MYNVKINDIVYPLPMASMYVEKLQKYLNGDTIIIDNLSLEELSEVLNTLFHFISMSLCAMEDEFGPEEVINEKLEIRKMITPIDFQRKWLIDKGEYEKSNEVVLKFLERMLKYYQDLVTNDYAYNERGF